MMRWHTYPTISELSVELGDVILALADSCIRSQRVFRIIVAGGTTLRPILEYLATNHRQWEAWQIYFADERCVPIGHTDRNSSAVRGVWLNHTGMAETQIHEIPAELGAYEGARHYAALIDSVSSFDLALLALGEDGHVASLFPAMNFGMDDDIPSVLPILDAPKDPPQRVTLTAPTLNRATKIICVATGLYKRQAVASIQRNEPIPALALLCSASKFEVWTDFQAMGN